jgi:hypothetical protein
MTVVNSFIRTGLGACNVKILRFVMYRLRGKLVCLLVQDIVFSQGGARIL